VTSDTRQATDIGAAFRHGLLGERLFVGSSLFVDPGQGFSGSRGAFLNLYRVNKGEARVSIIESLGKEEAADGLEDSGCRFVSGVVGCGKRERPGWRSGGGQEVV
jgi:hypothetical protein